MRGIGELARVSGLSISALRYYDGAGVLVPALVDPETGYRRYSDAQLRAARLIAGLRRTGMPVAEIAAAVRELPDPAAVRDRLAEHRRRLEAGLADAKRELLRVHALLDLEENLMTRITLPAAALAAAIDAVRFAASTDPTLPMLCGVMFDVAEGTLTTVATDRYRLAVGGAAATVEGPPVGEVLPLSLIDELRERITGTVVIDLTPERVTVESGGHVVEGTPLDVGFPDHHRLVGGRGAARRVTVDADALRKLVVNGPHLGREHGGSACEVIVLGVDSDDRIRLADEGAWAADAERHVAVNREFLLQALDAGGSGQLVLELDGPIKPLAVRVPGDDTRFSILMPVRH